MSVAIITGSAGLVGSEASLYFAELGLEIVGIDNDMRQHFFGSEASTYWQRQQLQQRLQRQYHHRNIDIRNDYEISRIFQHYGSAISVIIHTAAQPSHDWAARSPQTDFSINADGTLYLLEAARQWAPESPFIFTSTNKVYGDTPNRLPLVEHDTRWEIADGHEMTNGITEMMPIDQTTHSLFGVSKLAADVLVQEYGRYYGLPTVCFRGGCLTGPNHSGTQLHGFIAYLMKCVATRSPYTVFGYKGKQVRDNIHSADLIHAFAQFMYAPRYGEVYNIGGGRESNCSMLEAIDLCEQIAGQQLDWAYTDNPRRGDHIWWISDMSKFQQHYPEWTLTYDLPQICHEIYEAILERAEKKTTI